MPTDGNQKSPKRDVIRDGGMSYRSEEDGVKGPQLLDAIRRHHFSGREVGFATPIERVPVQLKSKALPCRIQHSDALWNHLFADTVARNDCNFKSLHLPRSLSVML